MFHLGLCFYGCFSFFYSRLDIRSKAAIRLHVSFAGTFFFFFEKSFAGTCSSKHPCEMSSLYVQVTILFYSSKEFVFFLSYTMS